jgi:DNA-3-methyladenine glycosylase I
MPRCPWCLTDPIYVAYHDDEWCVPVHDDQKLFELLILEGAQAGLAWLHILRRREAYTRAFENWDVEKVAAFDEEKMARLLLPDSGIVRNRRKVEGAVRNARAFLSVQEEFGSFDAYLWRFTEGRTLFPATPPQTWKDLPVESDESRALSRDLKQRGFSFVGPVICYSLLQACGLVNDHLVGCYKYDAAH